MATDIVTFYIGISALALFSILGTIGNSIFIFVIIRRYKLESWTIILLCHLAFCDLLTCLIDGPLWIAAHKSRDFSTCKAAVFMTCSPILGSSWTLVLIALERYIFIKYPLRHSLIMTNRRVALAVSFIWVVSLTVATSMVTIDLNGKKDGACLPTVLVSPWVTFTFFAIFTLLPIILMMFVYTYIIRIALYQQRRVQDIANVEDRISRTEQQRKERRTIMMLYAVVFAYALCILPYSVVAILDAISLDIIGSNRELLYSTSILWFINAVINPMIYTQVNKELRREVLKLFRCSS